MKSLNLELKLDNTRRRKGYCDELGAKYKAQITRSGSIQRSLKFGLNLEPINGPSVNVRPSLLGARGEANGSRLDAISKGDTSFYRPHLYVIVALSDSKVWLPSSHMYHEAKHVFAYHGVKFSSAKVDLAAMMTQKNKVVANLIQGIEGMGKVDCVKGYSKFVSLSEIFVDTNIDDGKAVLNGKYIMIASSVPDGGKKISNICRSEATILSYMLPSGSFKASDSL